MTDRIKSRIYKDEIEEKPRIPQFLELLDQMRAIHIKKNRDYATVENPYANFEFAGILAMKFKNPIDISFAALIGVKLSRLQVLLGGDRTPENESIDDTFLDLCTYCALWASSRKFYIHKAKE